MCGCTTSPPITNFPTIQDSPTQKKIIATPIMMEKQVSKKKIRPNTRYYRYKLKQKCLKKGHQTEEELNFCIKKLVNSNG